MLKSISAGLYLLISTTKTWSPSTNMLKATVMTIRCSFMLPWCLYCCFWTDFKSFSNASIFHFIKTMQHEIEKTLEKYNFFSNKMTACKINSWKLLWKIASQEISYIFQQSICHLSINIAEVSIYKGKNVFWNRLEKRNTKRNIILPEETLIFKLMVIMMISIATGSSHCLM